MEAEMRRAANKTYEQEEEYACQLPLLCCLSQLLQLLQQLLLQLIIGGGCMPAAIHAARITALLKTRRRQISSPFQGVSPPSSPSSIFGRRGPTSACRLGKLQCPPVLLQLLSHLLLLAHQVPPFFSSCCCCCANGLF